MSHSIHLPGPLRAVSPQAGTLLKARILGPTHKDGGEYAALCELRDPEVARLMVAAYNAFDSAAKRLGINAVEFAERMQEGGLAELAESHEELLADIDGLKSDFDICREISRSSYARRSRAILSRVKGSAS